MRRDGGRCQRCFDKAGGASGSPHHIIPRDEGGGDDLHNLLWLCHPCHDTVECFDPPLRSRADIQGSVDVTIETLPSGTVISWAWERPRTAFELAWNLWVRRGRTGAAECWLEAERKVLVGGSDLPSEASEKERDQRPAPSQNDVPNGSEAFLAPQSDQNTVLAAGCAACGIPLRSFSSLQQLNRWVFRHTCSDQHAAANA